MRPLQARPPFDDPDADIVIRSSDGVSFRTYKSNLTQVSPVFKAMFTLSQPSASTEPDNYEDGVAVVQLAETSRVLDTVLRICSPSIRSADFGSPALIIKGLAIAKKYEMDVVSSVADMQFNFVKYSSPVQAYFLACRYGLEQHAREAAERCLRQPFTEVLGANFQGLEGTESVLAFQRLLQYYLACRAALRSLFKSWKWMLPIHWSLSTDEKTSQFWLFKSNHCCRKNSCVEMKDPIGNSYSLQMWWAKLVRGLQERLEEGPCDGGPLGSTEALQLFMKDGPDCVTCRSLAIESITAFESELSARMCNALNEVALVYTQPE